jgi:Cd2+/Zn2+-exporting ATPase
MGGVGSDAAIEAADMVLMTDDISGIAKAMRVAKKTLLIVRENIVFSLGVKFAVMGLAVFGIASVWFAIFADVGVSVLAVLNALRSLGGKK